MKLKFFGLVFALILLVDQHGWTQRIELKRADPGGMEHDEWALEVLFSPDGQQVVSSGLDGRIRIWNWKSGELLRELVSDKTQSMLATAMSPDGRFLASGGDNGLLLVWNLAIGAVQREFQADTKLVNAVAFSPDGQYVAAGGSDGKVRVWNLDEEDRVAELSPDAGRIVSLAFLPDQEHLVVGALKDDKVSLNGEIGVWRWGSGEKVHRFQGPPAVRGLAISPDGRLLAASSFQRTVSLHVTVVEGQRAEGEMRLVGELDEAGAVTLWNLDSGDIVAELEMELGAGPLVFSPDGNILACAGEHGVFLLEFSEGKALELGRIDTQSRVDAIAFGPESSQLLLVRERERPAEFKRGGSAKVFNPYLIHLSLMAKEGWPAPGPLPLGNPSLTGGSEVEIWKINRLETPEELRFWEARRFHASDETERARELFEKLAEDYPSFAEVRRVLGILYAALDSAGEAEKVLKEAVTVEPSCARCYRTLGDFYVSQENWSEAASSYQQALESNPRFGIVSGKLADVYNRGGLQFLVPNDEEALQEAMTLFLNAISLRPGKAIYYGNFALAFYFRGDFDSAIRYWRNTLEMQPDYSRIYYNLGHAYRLKGDKEKALEAYRRYVAMSEEGEETRVMRAKQLIEELSKLQ